MEDALDPALPLTGTRLGLDGPTRAPASPEGQRAARITGALPPWLAGRLIRTAPARFALDGWQAAHWFDGLGMLFAFELGPEGARLRHRDLDSGHAAELRAGRRDTAAFATPMRRPLWRRLSQPVPVITDNANVNVVPRGEGLVALTESPRQLCVDGESLAVTGPHAWADDLGPVIMTAHPTWDRAKGVWVDVGTQLGARSGGLVLEHDPAGRARVVVARWSDPQPFYVHDFGVTDRHVILIGHPLRVNPLGLLFSERGYADHLRWRPGPMTLWLVDRATGARRGVEAPQGFVFHVIDAFEDGEDTVLDAAVYPDAAVVRGFDAAAFAAGPVDFAPRPVRYRVSPHREAATATPLSEEGFEFPVIDRSRRGPRRYTWGGRFVLDGARSTSVTVALDAATGEVRRMAEPGFVFGEPVFVGRPGREEEGDGVLLAVGSPTTGAQSLLRVLDARSLRTLADVVVDVPLPLGFHGGFAPARR